MSDPDAGGNKTVFRPSPLQALKTGGQASAPVPPPPPAPPPPAPPPQAKPAPAAGGGWRTALTIAFVVVTLLAVGYVVLQLIGPAPGAVHTASSSSVTAPSKAAP